MDKWAVEPRAAGSGRRAHGGLSGLAVARGLSVVAHRRCSVLATPGGDPCALLFTRPKCQLLSQPSLAARLPAQGLLGPRAQGKNVTRMLHTAGSTRVVADGGYGGVPRGREGVAGPGLQHAIARARYWYMAGVPSSSQPGPAQTRAGKEAAGEG